MEAISTNWGHQEDPGQKLKQTAFQSAAAASPTNFWRQTWELKVPRKMEGKVAPGITIEPK